MTNGNQASLTPAAIPALDWRPSVCTVQTSPGAGRVVFMLKAIVAIAAEFDTPSAARLEERIR